MAAKRSFARVLVEILLPLLLIVAGVGLVIGGRLLGWDAAFWAGLGLGVIGILWALISAFLHGIDIFDL